MSDTGTLLTNLILFGLLPLWGIAGFVDWCCHRATRIEQTSGVRESLIHAAMGVQLGIPILLGLIFEINIPILVIAVAAWLLHEFLAHWDVHYSAPLRHISIWETHAHNYMATIPLYTLMLLVVLNWDVVASLFSLDWQGLFQFDRAAVRDRYPNYLPYYLAFMSLLCVFPYVEELLRCMRAARQ